MLIATPYRDFDVRDRRPPKVISEVRKTYLNSTTTNLRPKLSAELLIKCNADQTWYLRRVQVRSGQLHVFSSPGEPGPSSIRLPLRHLSLQTGPVQYSLAICRGQNIVLTLKTADKKAFDLWVNVLAIELIRQTPLDAIKYLDILTLAECWTQRENPCIKDWNFNNIVNKDTPCINCEENSVTKAPSRVPQWSYEKATQVASQPDHLPAQQPPNDSDEVIENLLKKCQNVETYVPVKEKLFLFESLCKMGRKVRSSEDVSSRLETSVSKRAKSCHDLSNINTHIAVREICKYFEHRGEGDREQTQPQKGTRGVIRNAKFQKTVST